MSNVTFKSTGKHHIIEAKGHATGSVEVCAAISSSLQGLMWYLEKWGEAYKHEEGDGYLLIEFGNNLQCNTCYRLIYETLKGVENSNPDYLKVSEVY